MSSSSESKSSKVITAEFKDNVKEWIKYDDRIRELNNEIKELKNNKKDHEDFILTYLTQIGEKELQIHDSKLRKNVYKTKEPLKKETMFLSINQMLKNNTQSQELTNYIIDNRPTKERISLKRTKNKT